MPTFHIYKSLAQLNAMPPDEAERTFLDCCGSTEWARRMVTARPFPMLEALFTYAADAWFDLPVADHLEAFASHPKIGSNNRPGNGRGNRDALAEVNRLYEKKFGFMFIVCAAGKTPDELLAVCRSRLGNSVETELQIASEEQAKITEIRLNNLLER